jgi:hypothetical protein
MPRPLDFGLSSPTVCRAPPRLTLSLFVATDFGVQLAVAATYLRFPTFDFSPATSHRAVSAALRIFFTVFKARCSFIFRRKDWLDTDFQRPIDGEIGIIPA